MRMLRPALAVALLLAASGAAPAAAAGSPTVTVLAALPGQPPRPATGQQAVAIARANGVASALARPYKAELGWTAQWRRNSWWLVGVFESDWGTRFVVRASVMDGHYVHFGAGPTRQWILDNARPQVTTLYARYDPASAVAQMKNELLEQPPPPANSFPDFDPRNYTILDGAAELVTDKTTRPGWWFVYYARDLRTGQNVVVPVAGLNYSPAIEESIGAAPGATDYGIWGMPWDNVPTWAASLHDWISGVIAAHGWQPTNWPSTGTDPSFTVPPFFRRRLSVTVEKAFPGVKPSPSTARAAIAVARANVDLLAEPFSGELSWTAQWRGSEWWLVAVFRSPWGTRFVVRAAVHGNDVQFGTGPSRQWIQVHASSWVKRTLYTRLTPVAATALLQAEMLAGPVSRFDPQKYSILAGATELVRDAPPTLDSGPSWYAVYYARDRTARRDVVLAVTSSSRGPLVETTYEASTPGSTAYGFQDFRVLRTVPSTLSDWVRRVVANRGWRPTNFH